MPSKETVSPGDFVKIRGQWYPVRKANAKTVGHPHWTGSNGTSPWHEVDEHRKAADVSREDVARMVAETSKAFPGLADELRKAAPPKRDQGGTGGIRAQEALAAQEKPANDARRAAEVADARKAGTSAGAAEAPAFAGRGKLSRTEKADYGRILTRDGKERYYKAREAGKSHADALEAARTSPSSSATRGGSLKWGKAGGDMMGAMGMADSGGVSADLPDGGSVMISPNPNTGKIEMVRFTGDGEAVMLLTDAPSVDAAVKLAEGRLLDTVRAEQAQKGAPGGITQGTAQKMSDEQLERAMRRLMEAGTYDGPAFGIIEAELNRRDAEGNRRRR